MEENSKYAFNLEAYRSNWADNYLGPKDWLFPADGGKTRETDGLELDAWEFNNGAGLPGLDVNKI